MKLLRADLFDALPALDAESFDAICTDPPYGLEFMGKEWDRPWAVGAEQPVGYDGRDDLTLPSHRDGRNANCRRCGGRARGANRCRCKEPLWDRAPGSDLREYQAWCERWAAECFRLLKPGGHLLAFGGTRTYHRLAAGIEDAGFEIRDCIAWMYGCLTSDAEVLTENGWKRGVDVEVGERIAQWDPSDESVSLAPVERVYRAPYSGPLRPFRNDDTDQLVTPNHRVYHSTRRRKMTDGARCGWWPAQWEVSEAREVTRHQPTRLPLSGFASGRGVGQDYARLLAIVWTEGSFDKKGSGVRIYQSASANGSSVREIDRLVRKLAPGHRRYDRERIYESRARGNVLVAETTWFFTGELARRVRADLPGKLPTYELLWRMTLAEKVAFLESAMLGDGSGGQFEQKGREPLEWLQTLCHLIGWSGRVTMRRNRDTGAMSLRRSSSTELQHWHFKAHPDVAYDGEVWCVGVPTGAFLARRNGRIFVTGNSGFPKSLDVSKAIDKRKDWKALEELQRGIRAARAERGISQSEAARLVGLIGQDETLGGGGFMWFETGLRLPTREQWPRLKEALALSDEYDEAFEAAEREVVGEYADDQVPGGFGEHRFSVVDRRITEPLSEDGQRWQGWGTALKPAFEPIIVARKPLVGTVAANVLEHGTGALNIDGCRIPTDESWSSDGEPPKPREVGIGFSSSSSSSSHDLGRWPANVALDEEAAAMLDEQTGELVSNSGEPFKRNTDKFRTAYGAFAGTEQEQGFYGDRGGASRFFYCAKVSRAERNAGLDGFEAPSPDVTTLNPTRPVCNVCGCGTLVAGPGKRLSCGHDDYRFEPSEGGKRGEKDPARNHHPTVKPVALMRWLVRLVTPPGGRVLDPFLGSGTTGIAAALEGFRFAGVERDPGYFAIADARIRFWSEHGEQALTVVADGERAERRRRETADSGQLDLLS